MGKLGARLYRLFYLLPVRAFHGTSITNYKPRDVCRQFMTDLENIPQYVALNPQNPNRENWELLHRAGYADIKPLTLQMSVAEVINKAETISVDFGWEVAAAVPGEGRLEVTETTQWFRFKDDLILRVREAEGGGSIVDARSVSRFAGSDIGVNAARIRKLFAALQEE